MAGIPQVITEDRASGAQFIDGSLKFDSSKLRYLKRTPSTAGNRGGGLGVVGVNEVKKLVMLLVLLYLLLIVTIMIEML